MHQQSTCVLGAKTKVDDLHRSVGTADFSGASIIKHLLMFVYRLIQTMSVSCLKHGGGRQHGNEQTVNGLGLLLQLKNRYAGLTRIGTSSFLYFSVHQIPMPA